MRGKINKVHPGSLLISQEPKAGEREDDKHYAHVFRIKIQELFPEATAAILLLQSLPENNTKNTLSSITY